MGQPVSKLLGILSVLLIITTTGHAAQKVQLLGNEQALVQQLNRHGIRKETNLAAKQGLAAEKSYLHSFRGETLDLGSENSFHAYREKTDRRNVKHTRYRQLYRNIPVFGKEIVLHEAAGTILGINGEIAKGIEGDLAPTTPLTPAYSAKEALEHAKKHSLRMRSAHAATGSPESDLGKGAAAPEQFAFKNEQSELNIYLDATNKPRLVYYVSFYAEHLEQEAGEPSRPNLLIDAVTREVVKEWDGLAYNAIGTGPGGNAKIGLYEYGANNDYLDVQQNGLICTMQNANVITINLNNGPDPDTPFSYECPRNTVKPTNGAHAPLNDAHFFGGVFFNMYRDWYGVSPLPFPLKMRVHYGINYDNAFWNGSSMTFGDGYVKFYPLVGLDVVGHEVSHGFTEQNSGLIYEGESGGINEAFSDIAGEAVEFYQRGRTDFKHDADITKSLPALRYLDNPPLDGLSIGDYTDYFDGLNVHYSSGIFNKAFYLLATKPGWDARKAFDVMVKANQDYWVPTSTFNSASCGAISAARDLSYSASDVEDAFRSVNVYCAGPVISEQPTVAAPALLLPNHATSAGVGTPFSQGFSISGGVAPYRWSLYRGSLPPGLVLNSQTGQISGTPTAGGTFAFGLEATDSQGKKGFLRWALLVNEGVRTGWPKAMQPREFSGAVPLTYAPIVADLDRDGKKEVIVTHGYTLYVFHADGSFISTIIGSGTVPAVADIDGDGYKEILVTTMWGQSSLYAYRADLSRVTGFPSAPVAGFSGYLSSPVVVDFEGDGALKTAFVYSPTNGETDYGKNIVIVVDAQGNTVPGWPHAFGKYDYYIGRDTIPAVGDMFGDGKMELVFATADGNVRIFSGNGTLLSQWVFSPDAVEYVDSPILGDLDGDGSPELVVKYKAKNSYAIKVFKADGELLPGWPQTVSYAWSNPVMADIDGDGRLEILFNTYVKDPVWHGELHALQLDGTSLPNWPVRLPDFCRTNPGGPALTVADINGDGRQEVLLAAYRSESSDIRTGVFSEIYAFDSSGVSLPGFPKSASPNTVIATSAAIGDLDNNGRQDLVVKTEDGYLYAWEMSQTGGAAPQWPMFRNGEGNGGSWSKSSGDTGYPAPTALIGGAPESPTNATGAKLVIGGSALVAYKYSLDGASYSAELPVATPISLISLAAGSHTVAALGKDPAGNWQSVATTTTWTIDPWLVYLPGGGKLRTIGSAYMALSDNDIVRLRKGSLVENVLHSQNLKITLEGGYDPTTNTIQGSSTLYGSIRVKNGKLSIRNLRLLPPF